MMLVIRNMVTILMPTRTLWEERRKNFGKLYGSKLAMQKLSSIVI